MAITNDLSKGILFRDDCESVPASSGWGSGAFTSKYIAFTGGNQDFNNPDKRAGIYLSSDYARTGTKSYKLTLEKRTDYPPCCNWVRSELGWMANGDLQQGNEWKFASASILFPPSMDFGGVQRFQVLYDHKESPDDGNTKWWLGLQGNQFIVGGVHNGGQSNLGVTVQSAKWYDFILERTWGNGAYIKLYLNGKLVYEKYGNFFSNQSPFSRLQQGLYVWPWASSGGQGEGAGNTSDAKPKTMYIDEIRFGNAKATLQDFLLDGTTTPPVDPPPVDPPPTSGNKPTITPISDVTTEKTTIDVKVSATDNTANGHIKSFTIQQISGPNAAKVTQYSQSGWRPTTTNFKFETLIDGVYEFKVTTVDDLGGTASDNFKITRKGVVVPPVDTTNYYVSSVESTEVVNGKIVKSIIITWKDGTKTEIYKK